MEDSGDIPRPKQPDKAEAVARLASRAAQTRNYIATQRKAISEEAARLNESKPPPTGGPTWSYDNGILDESGEPFNNKFHVDEKTKLSDHDLASLLQPPSTLESELGQIQHHNETTALREDARSAIEYIQSQYTTLLTAIEADGTMRDEITIAYINGALASVLDESGISSDDREPFVKDLKQYLQTRDAAVKSSSSPKTTVDEELVQLTEGEEINSLVRTLKEHYGPGTKFETVWKECMPFLGRRGMMPERLVVLAAVDAIGQITDAIGWEDPTALFRGIVGDYIGMESSSHPAFEIQLGVALRNKEYANLPRGTWDAVKASPAAQAVFGDFIEANDQRFSQGI